MTQIAWIRDNWGGINVETYTKSTCSHLFTRSAGNSAIENVCLYVCCIITVLLSYFSFRVMSDLAVLVLSVDVKL